MLVLRFFLDYLLVTITISSDYRLSCCFDDDEMTSTNNDDIYVLYLYVFGYENDRMILLRRVLVMSFVLYRDQDRVYNSAAPYLWMSL